MKGKKGKEGERVWRNHSSFYHTSHPRLAVHTFTSGRINTHRHTHTHRLIQAHTHTQLYV